MKHEGARKGASIKFHHGSVDPVTLEGRDWVYCFDMGMHCVKHGSNLQWAISFSSGESECYALVKASATGTSVRALLEDWGVKYDVTVYSDSSAARGTASRSGLGKLRHVQTTYLWIQERIASDDFELLQISAKQNTADLCTKPMSRETCEQHMKILNQEFHEGKAKGAKALESTKV